MLEKLTINREKCNTHTHTKKGMCEPEEDRNVPDCDIALMYSHCRNSCIEMLNHLTLNDSYSGHTAPLTSKRCILYIYSTNTGNEYFKHGIYSPFFPLQNAVCFINLTYLIPVLFTLYIEVVLKLKK